MEHGVDEENSVDFPQVPLVTVKSSGRRREGTGEKEETKRKQRCKMNVL